MTIRLLVLAIVATFSAGSTASAEPVRPNIIVIVGDDVGYADIGIHGSQDVPTPNIDRLATAGVRCTSGYVSCAYCAPTRAGLLTGRYQTRFGHEFNPRGQEDGLPLSERTLAERLRTAGYATGMVGKWHLGGIPAMHPMRRGFQEFFGFLGGANSYFPGTKAGIMRGTEAISEPAYLTDAFGREAAAFVDRHRDEPFFLYLAFNAVHTPMQADEDRLEKFRDIADPKRRTYAAMMSAMDDAIGVVLGRLREHTLDERTLVFFISDNGGPTMSGTTTNASRNDPLRGSKRTTLEGGIRVPFIVSWPGTLPTGKVSDSPVIQLDILPTALAAAGEEVPSEREIDGVNLLPHLTGVSRAPPHESLFWRFGPQMAIRRGEWKLVRYDPHADGKKGDVTAARLYNLADDVGEQTDRISEHPDKAAELQALWNEWNQANVSPLWGT